MGYLLLMPNDPSTRSPTMTATAQPQPTTHQCPVCRTTFNAKQATMPCRGPNGAMHPPTKQVRVGR